MIKKIKDIIIQLVIVSAFPALVFAAWQGPLDILSGTWGKGAGKFGPVLGNLCYCYFAVDKDGMILIHDGKNKRIAVYDATGKLNNYIYKPAVLPALDSLGIWPEGGFVLYSGGNSLAIDCEYEKTKFGKKPLKTCFVNYNGDILGKIDSCEIFPNATGYVGKKNNIFTSYDPSGKIIKTNILWAPEMRDASKNLYVIQESSDTDTNNNSITTYQITRYNQCSKQVATLALPKSLYALMPLDSDDPAPPVVEFGSPVLAPNGDVYTWKRTPENKSIVKWTWVDDPNTPPCKE